jgi:hypothetical protein
MNSPHIEGELAVTDCRIRTASPGLDPVGAILVALAVAGWSLKLTLLPYVAGAVGVVLLVQSARGALSRLRIGLTGIRGRGLLRRFEIAWPDVFAMTVERGVLRTHVKLYLSDSRTRTLPALSMPWYWRSRRFIEGLDMLDQVSQQAGGPAVTRRSPDRVLRTTVVSVALLGAVAVNHPWFWIGPDNYSSLPNPCAALTVGPAATYRADAAFRPARTTSSSTQEPKATGTGCFWSSDSREIGLSYITFGRDRLMSGAGVASADLEYFASIVAQRDRLGDDLFPIRTFPDVGDEAIQYSGRGGVQLIFRTSNLVGIVSTTGADFAGSGLAEAIAHDAFAQLEVAR